MINIKYIFGTQSERPDCEKNYTMSNWNDRFMKNMKYFRISRSVKKPFPFHEMINFIKWLRHIYIFVYYIICKRSGKYIFVRFDGHNIATVLVRVSR
jgi:hypothetical protein